MTSDFDQLVGILGVSCCTGMFFGPGAVGDIKLPLQKISVDLADILLKRIEIKSQLVK